MATLKIVKSRRRVTWTVHVVEFLLTLSSLELALLSFCFSYISVEIVDNSTSVGGMSIHVDRPVSLWSWVVCRGQSNVWG